MIANGCRWYKETFEYAISNSYLEVTKWARANECSLPEDACRIAARYGSVEALKWVREEQECSWNQKVAVEAVERGHLEILKWLRANRCPWPVEVCV